jgi:2-haloacid dehalogenase
VTIKALVFDAYGTLYDIQSVAAITEEEFPGFGEIITQIWRIKQLEYTWLRSLMRRYEDFSVITRDPAECRDWIRSGYRFPDLA